jgi:hypothetical protein
MHTSRCVPKEKEMETFKRNITSGEKEEGD